MVNKAILVGRLGRDPETRYTGAGTAVANFSMATDETFKDRNGEKQKRTEWHKIVAWGKLAEIVQKYCKKGQLVFIEGSLSTREWQDKEGVKRYTTEITARELRMLGGNGNRDEAPAHDDGDAPRSYGSGSQPQVPSGTTSDISDEDIPF